MIVRLGALVACGFGVSWCAWRAVATRQWLWVLPVVWYAVALVSIASVLD